MWNNFQNPMQCFDFETSKKFLKSILDDDLNNFILQTNQTQDINNHLDFVNREQGKKMRKLPNFICEKPTLLSLAAFFGSSQCFDHLLTLKANLKEMDNGGKNAAHFAAAGGSTNILSKIIKSDPELLEKEDNFSRTPFHYACLFGHFDVVMFLWSKGSVITAMDRNMESPVHFAAFSGSLKIIQFLIEYYTSLDISDTFGRTPLMCACIGGHSEVVKFLISTGKVDINKTDKDGITSLIYAVRYGSLKTVKELLESNYQIDESNQNFSALVEAACYGHIDIVRYLVQKGFDVNIQTKEQQTPIYKAIMNGHVEVVRFLIENKALLIANGHKHNLIKLAANYHNSEILEIIESHPQFSTLLKDAPIKKLLLKAILRQKVDIARVLAKRIESLSFLSKITSHFNNETGNPIQFAIDNNNFELLQFLVESGVNINHSAEGFLPPIIDTFILDQSNFAKYLIDKGAIMTKNLSTFLLPFVIKEIDDITTFNILMKYQPNIITDPYGNPDDSYMHSNPLNIAVNQYIEYSKEHHYPIKQHDKNLYKEIIRILVENGANLDIDKQLIYGMEFSENWLDALQYIDSLGFDFKTKLICSSTLNLPTFFTVKGKIQNRVMLKNLLDFLIEHGFSINMKAPNSLTFLMYLIQNGLYLSSIYENLFKIYHLDPNCSSSSGLTPLGFLVRNLEDKYISIINLLLDYGANPNVVDYESFSPFMYCCLKTPDYKKLIENNTDETRSEIEQKVKDRNLEYYPEILQKLIDHGGILTDDQEMLISEIIKSGKEFTQKPSAFIEKEPHKNIYHSSRDLQKKLCLELKEVGVTFDPCSKEEFDGEYPDRDYSDREYSDRDYSDREYRRREHRYRDDRNFSDRDSESSDFSD